MGPADPSDSQNKSDAHAMWHHRRRRGGQEYNRWCKFAPRIRTSSCEDKNTELIELKQGGEEVRSKSHFEHQSIHNLFHNRPPTSPCQKHFQVSRNIANISEDLISLASTSVYDVSTRNNNFKETCWTWRLGKWCKFCMEGEKKKVISVNILPLTSPPGSCGVAANG